MFFSSNRKSTQLFTIKSKTKLIFQSSLRLSAFVLSVVKSLPPLLWLPRSVLWVCLPRRLVMTSLRPLKIGKAWKSLSGWPSKIVKQRSTWCPVLPLLSSRPSRNLLVTVRRWRTSSTMATSPWTTFWALLKSCDPGPCPRTCLALWRKSWERRNP